MVEAALFKISEVFFFLKAPCIREWDNFSTHRFIKVGCRSKVGYPEQMLAIILANWTDTAEPLKCRWGS